MAYENGLDINEIKNKLNIVDVVSRYINVTKKGNQYVALCPFHNDSNPSLQISKDKNIFKCYACGEGGNPITFIQKYEKISFKEALYKAAEMAGIDTTKYKTSTVNTKFTPYYKCLKDLNEYYCLAIETSSGKDALQYCEDRGLNSEIRNKFHIGYAPTNGFETIKFLRGCENDPKIIDELKLTGFKDNERFDLNQNRVIFGITNKNGDIVGFSARKYENLPNDDSPKYINSKENVVFNKSSILYNYDLAKSAAKKCGYIYVLEGFMDVISLYKAGIESAVGLMGTALTKEHILMLKNLNVEIRLSLDNDIAGQTAIANIIKLLDSENLNYRIVKKRDLAKDCDEILNKYGKDELINYLNNLISKQDFIIDFYSSGYDLNDAEERKNFVYEIIKKIGSVKDPLDIEEYSKKISKISKFSQNTISKLIENESKNTSDKVIDIYDGDASYDFMPSPKTNETNFNYKNKKLGKLENELLYQMLISKDAVEYFSNNIEFFLNPTYSQIALYLEEYINLYDDVNADNLISFIAESDDGNKSDELINTITFIASSDDYHLESNEKTVSDIGEKLLRERDLYQKMTDLDNKLASDLNDEEKAKLLIEKAKLKKLK